MNSWILQDEDRWYTYDSKEECYEDFQKIIDTRYPDIIELEKSGLNDLIAKEEYTVLQWRGWMEGWIEIIQVIEATKK